MTEKNSKHFLSAFEIKNIIYLTLVHVCLAIAALNLVTPEEKISLMWFPDGYLLAVLVISRYRIWLPLILSICFCTILIELSFTERALDMIMSFLFANMIEAVGGAWLFNKFSGGEKGFQNYRQFSYFLLFCVAILPAISAFIGAYTVVTNYPDVDLFSVYRTWYSSAGLGILFVAPLIIFGFRWGHLQSRPSKAEITLFITCLSLVLVVVYIASILPKYGAFDSQYFIYFILPFISWIAVRFGMFGSIFASSFLVLLLVVLTAFGIGPFFVAGVSASELALKLQVYTGTLLVTSMFVALSSDSLSVSNKRLLSVKNRFANLFNKSPVSLWEEDFSLVKNHIDNVLVEKNISIEQLFEQFPEQIAYCAQLVRIENVNEKTLQLFGASSAPELISNLGNIFTDESLKVFKEEVIALYNGEMEFKAEAEQKKIDGTPIYTITSVILAEGFEASWRKVIVSIEDITKRRENELKLNQAAAVYASTSEGVVVTDIMGNVMNVNQAFSDITGYSELEVLGKNLRILKSDNHNKQFYQDMWSALHAEGFWRDEIWNRRKSGAVFPELLTINTIYGEDGEPKNFVAVFSDISKLKETEDKLYHLANHDPLTGLPNRLLFKDRFGQAIRSASRNNGKIGVIFLDVDRFKIINDTLGHSAGDKVLKEVAKRLKKAIRNKDTVARVSGDEFVILIEDFDKIEVIAIILDKVFNSFSESIVLPGDSVRISVSAGISVFPDDGEDMDTLYRNADTAMYNAKESGRNSYFYYTKELNATAMEYIEIENALHLALKNKELFIVFQPQVDINSQELVGLEVLLRWQHPVKGLISPATFIPIAERSGLINEIGQWVLEQACYQGKLWLDRGIDFGRLAVNASGQQLQNNGFAQTVEKTLNKYEFPGSKLEIEVTETFVMKRLESSIEELNKLKLLGVEISIDDFGTGYSSLSYLKQLPIDKLKIDQSFVKNIPDDFDDMAIIDAILAISKALNMIVIAEGVEKVQHSDFLIKQGCDQAQGYLYSKPLLAKELEEKFF